MSAARIESLEGLLARVQRNRGRPRELDAQPAAAAPRAPELDPSPLPRSAPPQSAPPQSTPPQSTPPQ
ncbi:MAG: hypothetical protein AAF447_27615, partial [Myxococcota bacterium]